MKVYRCDRCGAEGKEIHEKEDGEQEERSLLRKLLGINRTAMEYLTPFAFGVTCVFLYTLGDAVDQQTPAVLEPPSSLPEWSGDYSP